MTESERRKFDKLEEAMVERGKVLAEMQVLLQKHAKELPVHYKKEAWSVMEAYMIANTAVKNKYTIALIKKIGRELIKDTRCDKYKSKGPGGIHDLQNS